jgi:hypothetical protein
MPTLIQRLGPASAIPRIFCMAASALLVTGCSSGSSSSATPVVNRQPGVVGGFLNGEVLRAHSVLLKSVCSGPRSKSTQATFSAKGSAKGPYPGPFTISGAWKHSKGGYSADPSWSIHESFTISSTQGSMKGSIAMEAPASFGNMTCHHFGPFDGLQYLVVHDGRHSGTVSIMSIGQDGFSETFQ